MRVSEYRTKLEEKKKTSYTSNSGSKQFVQMQSGPVNTNQTGKTKEGSYSTPETISTKATTHVGETTSIVESLGDDEFEGKFLDYTIIVDSELTALVTKKSADKISFKNFGFDEDLEVLDILKPVISSWYLYKYDALLTDILHNLDARDDAYGAKPSLSDLRKAIQSINKNYTGNEEKVLEEYAYDLGTKNERTVLSVLNNKFQDEAYHILQGMVSSDITAIMYTIASLTELMDELCSAGVYTLAQMVELELACKQALKALIQEAEYVEMLSNFNPERHQ